MEIKEIITNHKVIYLSLFVIPLNIFIISNDIGFGLQWIFFRYQITYLGSSTIPITADLNYILTGVIKGKSAISELTLVMAMVCFVGAFILLFSNRDNAIRESGYITLIGGILLVISQMIQYGVLLHGPAGISIPVGVPLIFFIGIFLIKEIKNNSSPNNIL